MVADMGGSALAALGGGACDEAYGDVVAGTGRADLAVRGFLVASMWFAA